jgi:DNA polymerase III delta prime subunit
MTPKIIVTDSIEKYLKKNHLSPTQTKIHLIAEKDTITIGQIKKLIHLTNLTSDNKEKSLFIIEDAHKMSLPAQNCLLKTLEESTENNLLLLFTNKPKSLLPTITSRCLTEKVDKDLKPQPKPLDPPLSSWSKNPGEIINLTDQIIKNNPKKYFENALNLIHQASIKNPNSNRTAIQKSLLTLLDHLDKNTNPRLTIDHFFFSIMPFINT